MPDPRSVFGIWNLQRQPIVVTLGWGGYKVKSTILLARLQIAANTRSAICNLYLQAADDASPQPSGLFFMVIDYMMFATVGARLAPLSSLDEIAGFFLAASTNASHAPSRASTITQWFGGSLTDAACMLSPMFETLSSMPGVQKILALLPPVENMSLGTDRTTCFVCERALEPAEHCATAPLFSAKGCIKTVRLFQRKCSCCGAEHHMSYARGTSRVLSFELCRF